MKHEYIIPRQLVLELGMQDILLEGSDEDKPITPTDPPGEIGTKEDKSGLWAESMW